MRRSDARILPTHNSILRIAVPVMLSNVSTPLIGVVDTAVVGHLPNPAYLGAAAVGGMIFSVVFWGFGFLRMGTTGLTAQARGAGDHAELALILGRAVAIALAAGLALILLQWPIRAVVFAALGAPPRVDSLARGYFGIRIWAAPATLANYALLGWFIGLGRADIGLILQLVLNVANVLLDLLFVWVFKWDVRGVAAGTTLAECLASGVGMAIALHYLRSQDVGVSIRNLFAIAPLRRTLIVNGNIMIRSLSLMAAFLWFVAQGARRGEVILAANSILLQFVSVAAFFLDGLAFATEVLVGRALGAAHRAGLIAAVRMTTAWAAGTSVLLSLGVLALGPWFIDALTVAPSAREAARIFLPWAAGAPILGVWAYQLDGVFIGATQTADMRNAMLFSLAIYLAAWWLLRPFGNHGLWAAFYVHYVARAASLLFYYPGLVRRVPLDIVASPSV